MCAIEAELAVLSVGDQATLVAVEEHPLAPSGADIVLGSGADDGRVVSVTVEVHFYLAFAPPTDDIGIGDDTDVRAEEAAFALDSRQNLEILVQRGPALAAPSSMEVNASGSGLSVITTSMS